MSWRTVVVTERSKLDYQMGYLVIRKDNTTKVFINEISILIIETTAVSLTAALLNELVKNKVKIIFCDEKRNPASELLPYYGSHDTSLKVRNQIKWSKEIKDLVWTEIVKEKISKQAGLLEKWNYDQADLLKKYISEVDLADCTNREGHAAKVYFNALFGLDFTREVENSTNAALNYGYAILLSAFNREITANGYITQLALFHDNMFNQFNFGSDLMEPFRPLVDDKVKEMCPQKFESDEKKEMVRVLSQSVIINGKKEYVSNAIGIYCKSIFEALNEENISFISYYRNEL